MKKSINWSFEITITDFDAFINRMDLFFKSNAYNTKIDNNVFHFFSTFKPISNKRYLDMIDGGSFSFFHKREDEYDIEIRINITRMFYFWVFGPFILVLTMLIYNYLINPFFQFNWIKLAVIILSFSGYFYIKIQIPKIKAFVENLLWDFV